MGQLIRCPLIGVPCSKSIAIQEKSFFLAEAEKPEEFRKRRIKAINEAIVDGYIIRSALEEKGINAFTCKICEMMQSCAYGIADISGNNPNVLFELGMMIAMGKATIILLRKDQEVGLNLPSDLSAIEIIPFTEYIDIIDQLRDVVQKLPPPVSPPNPIQDLEKIQPKLVEKLRTQMAQVAKEFKDSVEEAKLNIITPGEDKKAISPELDERLKGLEEKLEDMRRLGFAPDAETASSRAYYFYNRGKYKEALACLNWAVELRPNAPDILSNRGLIYCELGRHEESLADYNRSLKLKPDDPEVLSNRGLTYCELGRHEESLADYNRSLKLKPDDPEVLSNRGATYAKVKRYDEALADFNRALELKPDGSAALYNLACLFSLWGKPKESIAYLKKAIALDRKWREKAKADTDFGNIRDDPRFKKLIELD